MRYRFSWDSRSIILTAMTVALMIAGIGEQRAIAQTTEASCKLDNSVYRDVQGKGFELIINRVAPGGPAAIRATARLRHERRGQIFQFNMTQSQGYGSTFLGNKNSSHLVNFFNSDWSQERILLSGTAPTYLFASGLGSEDYYRNSSRGSRQVFLGDVMWKLDRCNLNGE